VLDFTGVGNCQEDQCSLHVLYTDGDDAQAVEIKRLEIRTTRNRKVERDKKDDGRGILLGIRYKNQRCPTFYHR